MGRERGLAVTHGEEAAVVLVLFGLGLWAFGDMRDHAFLGLPHGAGPHGQVVRVIGPAPQ